MGQEVTVIGGGLAGSECALTLAKLGVPVKLYEMRPKVPTAIHKTDKCAELVCSNSLKSLRGDSAAGLLKREIYSMGSSLITIALDNRVPAGGALAVDRENFSAEVTNKLIDNPLIELCHEEVRSLPDTPAVIAAGPLCSDALFSALTTRLGGSALSFFDAAAPIVDAESLNHELVFAQSRYDKGGADYLNCPLSREEYETFISELVGAKRVLSKDFEQKELFSACQPIEEVARTGLDSLRFGALKPVGLSDPRTGKRPWAAVQLRAENSACTAYNLVGFQTNLTWAEQARVFRMIPGLEQADFFRYGVMHRNSFVDAPHVLDAGFKIPGLPIRLAGQITGTEGYTEAIATGFLAALNMYCDLCGHDLPRLPVTTALGALLSYAHDRSVKDYQPMHVNFGLVPPIEGKRLSKKDRYSAYAQRAQQDLMLYLKDQSDLFGRLRRDWPTEEDFA